jgi:guanylate kinase
MRGAVPRMGGAQTFPVVLAAPSGAGKTTLARALVRETDRFCFSVSATTRAPRRGERDGVDYAFVDRRTFEAMASRGELAEWASVHDDLYGTPKSELTKAAERGEHVVLDIDVQGARLIRAAVPEAVLIFVLPPSAEALLGRLTGRGTEDPAHVARRLRSSLDELAAAPEFDYVVVNDDLDQCLDDIRAIVRAESLHAARTEVLASRLDRLRAEIVRILQEDYANLPA